MTNQEQIEEARKLLKNYNQRLRTILVEQRKKTSGLRHEELCHVLMKFANGLVDAVSLIAASEQREKNQEVIRKAFDNIMQREGEVDGVELLIEAEAKILKGLCHGNPIRTGELHCGTFSQCKTIEAQQNISSNPPPTK